MRLLKLEGKATNNEPLSACTRSAKLLQAVELRCEQNGNGIGAAQRSEGRNCSIVNHSTDTRELKQQSLSFPRISPYLASTLPGFLTLTALYGVRAPEIMVFISHVLNSLTGSALDGTAI